MNFIAETSTGKISHPGEDALIAIFYSYQFGEGLDPTSDPTNMPYKTGIIIVESEHFDRRMMPRVGEVNVVSNELDLINTTIDMVLELDPDILAGWEVQAASWGYLEARGRSFGQQAESFLFTLIFSQGLFFFARSRRSGLCWPCTSAAFRRWL